MIATSEYYTNILFYYKNDYSFFYLNANWPSYNTADFSSYKIIT